MFSDTPFQSFYSYILPHIFFFHPSPHLSTPLTMLTVLPHLYRHRGFFSSHHIQHFAWVQFKSYLPQFNSILSPFFFRSFSVLKVNRKCTIRTLALLINNPNAYTPRPTLLCCLTAYFVFSCCMLPWPRKVILAHVSMRSGPLCKQVNIAYVMRQLLIIRRSLIGVSISHSVDWAGGKIVYKMIQGSCCIEYDEQ